MARIRQGFADWMARNTEPGEWDHPPTKEEIRAALDACPNGRAAGKDDLPYEALKRGGEVAIDLLHSLFEMAYMKELHPREWDTGSAHSDMPSKSMIRCYTPD